MNRSDELSSGPSQPPRVFISHVAADRELADEIRRKLAAAGAQVWSPQDEIPVGASLRQGLAEGLRNSDAAVLILSEAAQAAPWTSMELASLIAAGASRGHPRLIPVIADRNVEIPALLRDLVYADASRPERRDNAVDAVVRAVIDDTRHSRPDFDLLARELSVERLLFDVERREYEVTAGARRRRAAIVLVVLLQMSLVIANASGALRAPGGQLWGLAVAVAAALGWVAAYYEYRRQRRTEESGDGAANGY